MTNLFPLLLLLLIIPVWMSSAYGVVDDFTTDKSLYHNGDQLIITGTVFYDPAISNVVIQIFDPFDGFTDFNEFPVNSNGDFSAEFGIGPTWSSDGSYTIRVSYDGILVKPVEYREFSESYSPSEPTPSSESYSPSEPTPSSESYSPSEPTPSSESSNPVSDFTTLKFQIPDFPALDKSPQYYLDRYNIEPSYKTWFDSQFPDNSIDDVVGYKLTGADNFPALDKSPQYYLDRYNIEPSYKTWFDSQFPHDSIYHILGYEDPVSVPNWIKNNAEWWASGKIVDSTFVTGIEFMLENNIIMISNVPSGNIPGDEIPDWIRNNAHWWSQDLISEDEFVNSLKFLIQNGIIPVN